MAQGMLGARETDTLHEMVLHQIRNVVDPTTGPPGLSEAFAALTAEEKGVVDVLQPLRKDALFKVSDQIKGRERLRRDEIEPMYLDAFIATASEYRRTAGADQRFLAEMKVEELKEAMGVKDQPGRGYSGVQQYLMRALQADCDQLLSTFDFLDRTGARGFGPPGAG